MKSTKRLITTLVAACTLATPAFAEKYAVLIGIEDYSKVGASNLPGCLKDVEDVQAMLTGKFGFPASNISTLKDAQATQANVLISLEELVTKCSQMTLWSSTTPATGLRCRTWMVMKPTEKMRCS